MKKIGVVILNYNGWQDTIACAESVLAGSMRPAWLIIVDNASSDNSAQWIRGWAKGHLDFALPELGAPALCPKPLPLKELREDCPEALPEGCVGFLRRTENRGYAAGNNAAIRIFLQWGADAVWTLNNDTIVDKNALEAMQRRLFSRKRPGLCGSLLLYRHSPQTTQCLAGGRHNKWTGLARLEGKGLERKEAIQKDADAVERRINFIYGASVMASRKFLEEAGLMDERYFLYCEEQDWAYAGKDKFDFAYAPDAIVWHKEGASAGFSHASLNLRNMCGLAKSRLLLAAKYTPLALPTVALGNVFAAFRLLWRRFIIKT